MTIKSHPTQNGYKKNDHTVTLHMTIWFQFGSNEKVPISFQSSQKVGIYMYWNVTFFDIYFLKLFPKPFYIPPKLEPHLKGIIPNIIYYLNEFFSKNKKDKKV